MFREFLKVPEKTSDTSYRSAVATITDRYMASRLKPPFGNAPALLGMYNALNNSKSDSTLPLTDSDIEFYHRSLPEVYFFILATHTYRVRTVVDFDGLRNEYKETLKNVLRDYEGCLSNEFMVDPSTIFVRMFSFTLKAINMEKAFRFQFIEYILDIITDIINEAAGLCIVLMHGFIIGTCSRANRVEQYLTYELCGNDEVNSEGVKTIAFDERFLSINISSILASLMSVVQRGLCVHNSSAEGMGDMASAWLRHLIKRNDGLGQLCESFTLTYFFNNSGLYNDRYFLEQIRDSSVLAFGADDPRTKNVKRHMNYMKLKHAIYI